MLTYEKVIEIFEDYLAADHEEEVLRSRRGYVRVQWNGDSRYCENGCLCDTPEELFEMLLEDYRGYEETKLTKGRRHGCWGNCRISGIGFRMGYMDKK